MIRVLYITARADIGGGQECLYRLATQARKTSEAFIACPREEPYWSRFEDLVGRDKMVEIPHRRMSLAALGRLRRFARINQIDIIHSHGLGAGLYSRPLGLLSGIPSVHTFHGVVFRANRPLWTAPRLAAEWALSFASKRLIAASNSEVQHLSNWLFPNGYKIHKIHYGMPSSSSRRSGSFSPENPIKILWVGRMHEQKDPFQVVDIASLLKTKVPPGSFTIEMVGDGPLMEELKTRLKSQRLTEVITAAGSVVDTRPCFRRSDILLSTSGWEGLPNVILEAMDAGLLVIASKVHGNVDIVQHQVTGLLFPKDSAEEAADLLSKAILGNIEPERLCHAAKQRVATEFGMERYAAEHAELYEPLVGR